MQTIPLSLLGQGTQTAYKLAPGDVMGIWIEGILGETGQPPPVSMNITGNERTAIGYPHPRSSRRHHSLPLVAADQGYRIDPGGGRVVDSQGLHGR